jgi:hypothetical protein
MELEGMIRCRKDLDAKNVKVTSVTTDRHVSIRSYMETKWSEVQHFFDTWHLTKGSLSAQTVQDAGRCISLSTTFSPPFKYIPIRCHSYGTMFKEDNSKHFVKIEMELDKKTGHTREKDSYV